MNYFLEALKSSFSDFNSDQVQALVYEAQNYFVHLQTHLISDHPKLRDRALQEAIEIQQFLESKAEWVATHLAPITEEETILIETIKK